MRHPVNPTKLFEHTDISVPLLLFWAGAVVTFYLIGIGAYPLMGTTEGRYGEMARKMVTTGQYLVPMFTDTEPFWGKPPMSMWFSAASFHVFGINEFAARLPSWLSSVTTSVLLYRFIARSNPRIAALSTLIWCSSFLGYTAFTKVHTDAALTFSVALAMIGFYEGLTRSHSGWLFAGFAGIALGLLCKGPVTLVYVCLPLVAWLWQTKRLKHFLSSPLVAIGAVLTIAVTLPWYIAAENAFPGFLEYFLIGEHFQRFTNSGWLGDLYGAGHAEAKGTIVLFAIESLLPWSVLVPVFLIGANRRREILGWLRRADQQTVFFLCWACLPLIFFCFSSNIVPNYVMPTLIAWSFLLAVILNFAIDQRNVGHLITIVVLALLLPGAKLVQNLNATNWYSESRNQKPLVDEFHRLSVDRLEPFVYAGERRYSAEFYKQDIIYAITSADLPTNRNYYLAMRSGRQPFEVPGICLLQTTVNTYELYHCED